ncbi:MAG: FAD-dependent oxidoreductase [Microthrixaceae bacterium]
MSPATGGASVYARGRLRPLPDGLVRGVPSHVGPLLRSGILSPTGIARAGLDLVAPRRDHGADPTIAQVIGGRFGLDTLAYRETALPHPLNGGGFVVPRSQGWLMTAGTFVSTKWPARHPPGQIILRCSAGRHGDDRPAALTDDDLVDRLHRELEQALGVTEGPVAGRPVGPLVSPVRGRPPRPGRPHRRHTGGGRARRGRHRRVDARRGRRRLHPPGPLRRPPGLARRLT